MVPGFAEQDKYDGRTGGVGIPAGRQAVTVTTPLFTLWVWSGLPEWPAHPARVPEAYPSLHLRLMLPQMPEGQVCPPRSCPLPSSCVPGLPCQSSVFVLKIASQAEHMCYGACCSCAAAVSMAASQEARCWPLVAPGTMSLAAQWQQP